MTRARRFRFKLSLAMLRSFACVTCALTMLPCIALGDTEATETFHIAEITKLMVGFKGDAGIQAVEIKMTAAGQNLVNGMTIAIYNESGVLIANLGTFGANISNSSNGGRILCATTKFQTTFGIAPDLLITGFIPVNSGQVVYEKPGCRVNALPYGAVTVPLASATVAPALPAEGATALERTVDDPTSPTCPLSEDAGNRFTLARGGPTRPITFTNSSGMSVNVAATIVGVGGTPPAPAPVVRVFPNPFRGSTQIEAPAWQPLTIHDVRGRLIRVLTCAPGGACPGLAGPYRGEWDGKDSRGRDVPSGIYFLRYAGEGSQIVKRIAVMR